MTVQDGLTMNQLAERNAEHVTEIAALQAKCDALAAENAALKSIAVYIFNAGYQRGHNSTVEGCFVDIHQNDYSTYHDDIVSEIFEEQTQATDATLADVGAKAIEACAEALLSNDDISCEYEYPLMREFAAQMRKEAK